MGTTGAALSLYQVGAATEWSSEGPGLLLITLGLGLASLMAGASWFYLVFRPVVRRMYLRLTSFLPAWIRLFVE